MDWPEKLSPELHQALLAARMDAKEIVKGDRADIGAYQYDFTSGEDMIAFCRQKLHDHGLTFELVETRVVDPDTNTIDWPVLSCRFHVVHVSTGSWEPRRYDMPFPNAKDLDKKAGGAMTYILGHSHRCLLDLPKVSRSDANHDPDRRKEELQAGSRTTRRQAAAPKGESTFQALTREIGLLAKDYRENIGEITDRQIAELALGGPKVKMTKADYITIRDWLKVKLVEEEQGPEWMDSTKAQEAPA